MDRPRVVLELPPILSNNNSSRETIDGRIGTRRDDAAVTVAEVTTIPPIVVPIALERWNIQKKRQEYESEIDALYRVEIQRCMSIDKASNERATKLYNEIFYKSKWSNPPLAIVQQKLVSLIAKS